MCVAEGVGVGWGWVKQDLCFPGAWGLLGGGGRVEKAALGKQGSGVGGWEAGWLDQSNVLDQGSIYLRSLGRAGRGTRLLLVSSHLGNS